MEERMMTFRQFMGFTWKGLIWSGIIAGIFLLFWGAISDYDRITWRYQRDLFLALDGRNDEVQFCPRAKEAAEIIKSFEKTNASAKEIVDALIILKHFEIGDVFYTSSSQKMHKENFPKIHKAFNLLALSCGGDAEETFKKLVKLEQIDRANDQFYHILELKEARVKLLKAIEGSLSDGELPSKNRVSFPLFPWWLLMGAWIGISVTSLIWYLVECASDKNYSSIHWRVPWGKIGTYLVILLWAPTSIPTLFCWGVWKLLSVDWIALFRRQREEAVASAPEGIEVDESVPRTPPPPERRVDEKRPQGQETPPLRWYIIQNFTNQRKKLAEAKIVFALVPPSQCVVTINSTNDKGVSGVAFPETERDKIFKVLGIEPYNIRELSTNRSNLYLLEFDDRKVFEARSKERFEKEKEKFRTKYVKMCQGRIQEELNEVQGQIENCQKDLKEHSRGIVKETRELEIGRKRMESLEELKKAEESDKKFGLEFEKLCSLAHVKWVEVEEGLIKVYTDTIFVDYDNKRYTKLGNYEISLYLNGDIRIRNLWDAHQGYDHPHIHRGNPCLGNIYEGINKLMAKYQFAVATQILIKFLESVNPDDSWGKDHITYWPRVRRSEVKKDGKKE